MIQAASSRRDLHVTTIAATSPSLSEAMRLCMLCAGLSKAAGVAEWVLGNPKTWLGTAYHAVLERVSRSDPAGVECTTDLDHLWQEAVGREYDRSRAHPLDRRFGEPPTWPGYYLAWANLRLQAKQFLARKAITAKESVNKEDSKIVLSEQAFRALGGKLTGRPDVLCEDEILDYKTGEIFEDDSTGQRVEVKPAYVRQLHLYGYLVGKALGRSPRRGVLLPMEGGPVEVQLEPHMCEQEALNAVALLDQYNRLVIAGTGAEALASPLPENCFWCPYKPICPVFWKSADESWFGRIDGEAARGRLLDSPKHIQGGRGITLRIAVDGGTVEGTTLELFPLNTDTHPVAGCLLDGDKVRITGLGHRQDGRVFPSARTLLFREADLPEIKVIPVPQSQGRRNGTGGKVSGSH